jgi:predicted acetyltransferase
MNAYIDLACVSYGVLQEQGRKEMTQLGTEIMRIARRGRAVAGGLLIHPFAQWFGGRSVPTGGIGAVAVAPEHRAAGVGARLMRAAVTELHRQGTALSTLYPATLALYRQAGYEIAGGRYEITLQARTVRLRDRGLAVRPIAERDAAAVEAAHVRAVRWANGPLDRRSPGWSQLATAWAKPSHSYAIWDGKQVAGFCRHLVAFGGDTLHMTQLFVERPAAARRMLTFLTDHRFQVEKVSWYGSPADPMLPLLAEPGYRVKLHDHWMLRITHLVRALSARGYAPGLEGRFDLDVRDDLLAGNRGRFRFEISDGQGTVRRGGEGRIRIDIRGLAALYSGHLSPQDLCARSDYLDAPQEECARLQPVFAGPTPWLAENF